MDWNELRQQLQAQQQQQYGAMQGPKPPAPGEPGYDLDAWHRWVYGAGSPMLRPIMSQASPSGPPTPPQRTPGPAPIWNGQRWVWEQEQPQGRVATQPTGQTRAQSEAPPAVSGVQSPVEPRGPQPQVSQRPHWTTQLGTSLQEQPRYRPTWYQRTRRYVPGWMKPAGGTFQFSGRPTLGAQPRA